MDQFPEALSHGEMTEVFENVYVVKGAMDTILMDMPWQFSRNMTIVRQGLRLIIINSIRLSEAGMAAIDALGTVTDVIRLGALHGRDDPYFIDRYQPNYWTLDGMEHESGLRSEHILSADNMPLRHARVFEFKTTHIPEAVIVLEQDGGIAIATDALQNWLAPDEFFDEDSKTRMEAMGFFSKANFGPVWMQAAKPQAEDFENLLKLNFKHALCGHGEPLIDTALADYQARFNSVFDQG